MNKWISLGTSTEEGETTIRLADVCAVVRNDNVVTFLLRNGHEHRLNFNTREIAADRFKVLQRELHQPDET